MACSRQGPEYRPGQEESYKERQKEISSQDKAAKESDMSKPNSSLKSQDFQSHEELVDTKSTRRLELIADQKKEDMFDPTSECEYYPKDSNIPDWRAYIEEHQPLELVKPNHESRITYFYNMHAFEQQVAFASNKLMISYPERKVFSFKKGYQKNKIGKCKYPSILIYSNQDEEIWLIREWRTSEFYMPQYLLYSSGAVWTNRMQSGLMSAGVMFKQRMPEDEETQFLRSLYLHQNLKILNNSDMQGEALAFLQTYLLNPEETFVLQETIRSPMDMRLIINNRNGVKYGNLSVRWDNRDYEYHLGSLEVYYWYNRLGKIVYQLEWGVEIPELVDDPGGERAAVAKGNFNKDTHRIRLFVIDPDLNEEVDFVGEFINLEVPSVLYFAGSRPRRQELNN
tara:strand:+ start:1269 stop:2459 length:1191 start_codon:yes stop_codon:yes gene_type:complete